jgi:hypothetical protein
MLRTFQSSVPVRLRASEGEISLPNLFNDLEEAR